MFARQVVTVHVYDARSHEADAIPCGVTIAVRREIRISKQKSAVIPKFISRNVLPKTD